ncbi:MAG: hypothetical protein E6J61_07100 [Deltaproteobacteria bacterium]|nr:MAG: hypothetical protein E6J61_07100 [Deltaproteobacteria bacterium]
MDVRARVVGWSALGMFCVVGAGRPDTSRSPWGGYSYPASYDAEIADPDVHRVLYEDGEIMFLEVANPPGLDVRMHGHPYPSVFARDAGAGQNTAGVAMKDVLLDEKGPFNGEGWGQGPPPSGLQFPRCTTSPPQGPHKPINKSDVPVHFYRIEFRRLDGDEIATRWKDWYPWMREPSRPVKNVAQMDSIAAAPDNYHLLYEDGHVRLLEVGIRPGETTPRHAHPYPAVLAFNAATPTSDAGEGAGRAPPPAVLDMKFPLCLTSAPQGAHVIHNGGSAPLHYYRIEFKRVDGEGYRTNWRKWYPWMQYMQHMR